MMDSTEEIVAQIERLGRLARAAQHAEGMKPAQWESLRYLSKARRESRNPGALADFLSSTRGTVSQTLIALEKKGLIQRLNSSTDGRAKRLELTEAGYALMTRDPLKKMVDAVAGLGDQAGLFDGLEGVVQTMVHENGNNSFGKCGDCRHYSGNGSGGTCGLMGLSIEADETGQLCRDFQSAPMTVLKPALPTQEAAGEWLS
ncbi:MAG: MarR family winged helix-turn-helix transcriptional regulator [Alphaproteobacteria bacterium]